MAQTKHYAAYDGGDTVVVGQQPLHEIYARPFDDAAKAGVTSMMCKYNQVEGVHPCGISLALQILLDRPKTAIIFSETGLFPRAVWTVRGMG